MHVDCDAGGSCFKWRTKHLEIAQQFASVRYDNDNRDDDDDDNDDVELGQLNSQWQQVFYVLVVLVVLDLVCTPAH